MRLTLLPPRTGDSSRLSRSADGGALRLRRARLPGFRARVRRLEGRGDVAAVRGTLPGSERVVRAVLLHRLQVFSAQFALSAWKPCHPLWIWACVALRT